MRGGKAAELEFEGGDEDDVGIEMGSEGKGVVVGAEGKGIELNESELPCAETDTLVSERVHVGAAFCARTAHFRFEPSDDERKRFVELKRGRRFVITADTGVSNRRE